MFMRMKTEGRDLPADTKMEANTNDIEVLQKELENLRNKLAIYEDIEMKCGSDAVIEIIFRDKEIAEKYKLIISKFLDELLSKEENVTMTLKALKEIKQTSYQETAEIFRIDKTSERSENTSGDVPFYCSTYQEYLQSENDGGPRDSNENPSSSKWALTSICFNCSGNHHLKDCPEVHNKGRIVKNKKSFRSNVNSSRYHEDEERRAKSKPGNISPALREALNLKTFQLPRYIYNMRVIGYPPGWLKEAEIETSGLNLYGSDGKAVEDDNTKQSSSNAKDYDTEKFIEYPGFNTPLPHGFVDEYDVFRLPPLQDHQQLREAKKKFHNKKTDVYKRSRSNTNTTPGNDSKQKKAYEAVSQEGVLGFLPSVVSTPKASSNSTVFKTPTSGSVDRISFMTPNGNSDLGTPRSGGSLSCTPGTAVVDCSNPFKKLPDVSNFSIGITEHLPYENLPDATGTYEKMRDVLAGVRQKLNESATI